MTTRTWNGTADWFTAGDWGGILPGAGDDDIIGTGVVSLATGDGGISAITLTIDANAEWLGSDTAHTESITGPGGVAVSGMLYLLAGGSLDITGPLTIAGAGRVALDPSALAGSVGGTTLTIGGTLTTQSSGATLDIGNSLGGATAPDTVTASGLTNSGAINLYGSSATATATLQINGAATGSGAVTIQTGGALTVTGGNAYTQTAGSTQVFADGTLTAAAIDIAGGTLAGNGTVAGALDNSGAVVEADAGGSPATLSVSGSYRQGAGATLAAIIDPAASTQSGVLAVSGGVALNGGTLAINSTAALALDTPYTVATFAPGQLSGSFATLQDGSATGSGTSVDLGDGTTLEAISNNNAGTIQVELVSTPAATGYTWDGGSGSWDTGSDWTPPGDGTTPGVTSDVVIGATADGDVTLNHNATINSLAITAGNTLVSQNTLTIGGTATLAAGGTLQIVNATIGGAVSDAGAITVGGGTLDAAGTVTVTGSLTLANATLLDTTLAGAGAMQTAGNTTDTLNSVTISKGSVFTAANNTVTYLAGTITNAGTLALDAGGNGTELRIPGGGTTTLTGGGTVSLSNSSNNLIRDADNATGALINADNTISGAGNIGSGEMSLDNQASGVIDADQPTALILQPNGNGVTNEGLLEATAAATLELSGSHFTQTGGTVAAEGAGSAVVLINTTVTGGTLTTSSGGVVESGGNTTDALDAVTIAAGSTYTASNNSVTYLAGTIVNDGTIALDGGGNGTELRVHGGGTTTLTGGGAVSLSNSTNNTIRDADNGTGTLINVGNTITGSGDIGSGEMSLDNRAAGVIDADQATPLILQPNNSGYSNEGLLEATAAGTLELIGSHFTQTGGTIVADGPGSAVVLINTTVTDGTLTTTSGGAVDSGGNTTDTLDAVTITAGSTYTASNNSVTYLIGTIVNDGTIALDAGGNGTELRIPGGGTTTLTGGGTVSLSNSTNNTIRDADNGTGTLINVNNTITGSGTIGNGQMSLDNQAEGVIDADQATALILNPNGGGYSNEGLLEATAAGTLVLSGSHFTQTSGTIEADGALAAVALAGTTVTGGTLNTVGGGAIESSGNTTDTLANLTISAGSTYTGANNTVTYLAGTIVNSGTIALDGGGNGTELRIPGGGTTTLTGGGLVSLSNSNNNTIRDADNGNGTLINVDNTITGSGDIGNGQMALDNKSAGVIDADQPVALVLQPNGSGYTNEGLLEATAGGTLDLNGSHFTQTGGTIDADGSGATVELTNTTVTGGTLTTQSGGAFESGGNTTNALADVTISAGSTYSGSNNSVTYLDGTILNAGTIALDGAGNGTELRIPGGGTTTLTGGGTVSLSDSSNNLIRDADNGNGELVNADNTIAGSGNIGNGELSLDNQAPGVIDADQSIALILQPNGAGYSNEGVLEATLGGTLDLSGSHFTQTAGTITANGSGSAVQLVNTTVTGGTLSTASGGVIQSAGNTTDTLANLTISAGSTYTGSNNTVTYLAGTIVNAGTIALDGGGNGTELRIPGGGTTTLEGGGTVSLSNSANNIIRDADNGSGTLINVDNTITGAGDIGNGQMSLDNQAGGTIDADQSTPLLIQPNGGGVTNDGTLEATNGALLDIASAVNGAGQLRIGAGSEIELGGATSENAEYLGSTGTLRIDNPQSTSYSGVISGFGTGDVLELAGTNAVSADPTTFNGTTTEVVVTLQGGGTFSYALAGDYVGDVFSVAPSGSASDVSVTKVTSGTPLINAPAAITLGVGQAAAIGGVSVAETPTTDGETFTASVADMQGVLSASNAGGATVTSSNGNTTLAIVGTLAQVNAALASLSDDDAATPSDAIAINVSDSNGGAAATASIAVTVNGSPVITVPGAQTVGQGVATTIAGVAIAESGNTNGETVTLTLSDTTGLLYATGTGVAGAHTATLTLSGTFTQVDADLATLTYSGASAGGDSIALTATDSLGGGAAPATIAVEIDSAPVTGVPGAQTVEAGIATVIGGITITDAAPVVTVTVTDSTGALTASGAAGTPHALTISGAASAVNADLATLTVLDAASGGDTITVNASDSLGSVAAGQTITVTVNAAPVITTPGAQTVGQNVTSAIAGLSVADSASSGAVTVTVTDSAGVLAAAGAVSTNGGHTLTLTGTAAAVTGDLAILTFEDAVAGGDTITLGANDALGGIATEQSVAVSIAAGPVIAAPIAQTVEQGVTTPVPRISVTDGAGIVTVTVTDATGTLLATGATGTAHSLTFTGSVAGVNGDLATLTFLDASAGSDTITLGATDDLGAVAVQKTVTITSNAPPAITVPAALSVGQSIATAIAGISITDAASSGAVTVSLTDTAGTLSATGATGTAHALTISGTLAAVNADLASLTFDDANVGSDTITATATDALGGVATARTIAIAVAAGPAIAVPAAQLVEQGAAAPIPGISLSDGAATVTVTLSDSAGVLAATGGVATNGGHTLTLSGSPGSVNADLATLTFRNLGSGADLIDVSASDSLGAVASAQTISVITDGPPAITVPGAQAVSQGIAAAIAGISVTDAAQSGAVTVTLMDSAGVLSATGAVASDGGHTLTLSGTIAAINIDLASLTFDDISAGTDTIGITASDMLGGQATAAMIAITVNAPSGQSYTLTTGADTVNGGTGADTVIASGSTLSAGDQINAGSGTNNTLVLQGAGLFNLAAPATLTGIETVTAQEGSVASNGFASAVQTVTLRDNLDLTIDVTPAAASGNPKTPTINIIGAHNADVINLGSGNDFVTVGDARETVNGGTGIDTITVNAATIGATINGGTSGQSALLVSGGGAVTMGPSITGITSAELLPAFGHYSFLANATSGLTVNDLNIGPGTVQLGGSNQILTGGGPGELTMVGSTAGADTFTDTAAALNGDIISNFSALGDLIDITNINPNNVQSPSFTQGSGSGVLSVTDGSHSAAITLAGTFTPGGFSVGADSAGAGILISYHG